MTCAARTPAPRTISCMFFFSFNNYFQASNTFSISSVIWGYSCGSISSSSALRSPCSSSVWPSMCAPQPNFLLRRFPASFRSMSTDHLKTLTVSLQPRYERQALLAHSGFHLYRHHVALLHAQLLLLRWLLRIRLLLLLVLLLQLLHLLLVILVVLFKESRVGLLQPLDAFQGVPIILAILRRQRANSSKHPLLGQ